MAFLLCLVFDHVMQQHHLLMDYKSRPVMRQPWVNVCWEEKRSVYNNRIPPAEFLKMYLPLCTAQIDFRLQALPFHLQTFRRQALGGDNLSLSSYSSSSLCPRCCQDSRAVIPAASPSASRAPTTVMAALIDSPSASTLCPKSCQRIWSQSAVFREQRSHKEWNSAGEVSCDCVKSRFWSLGLNSD